MLPSQEKALMKPWRINKKKKIKIKMFKTLLHYSMVQTSVWKLGLEVPKFDPQNDMDPQTVWMIPTWVRSSS